MGMKEKKIMSVIGILVIFAIVSVTADPGAADGAAIPVQTGIPEGEEANITASQSQSPEDSPDIALNESIVDPIPEATDGAAIPVQTGIPEGGEANITASQSQSPEDSPDIALNESIVDPIPEATDGAAIPVQTGIPEDEEANITASQSLSPEGEPYTLPNESTEDPVPDVQEDHIANESPGAVTNESEGVKSRKYVESELIVGFKPDAAKDTEKVKKVHEKANAKVIEDFSPLGLEGVHHVKLPPGLSVEDAILKYSEDDSVQYAEPNYLIYLESGIPVQGESVPYDSSLLSQWALHNYGQVGGVYDADIDALRAWSVVTGSTDVIIAVVDSGVDYKHPDLSPNIWINTDEIPGNGIDDDRNGYIDDRYGYDFYNGDSDPMDIDGHGTHCAGIIGAAGNNGIGVAGINWNIKIMPVKFSENYGGNSADAAKALLYAQNNGACIASNSWGWYGGSDTLVKSAIDQSNMLFVFSAGNEGLNTDSNPHYPSGYSSEKIISVAASDSYDNLAVFNSVQSSNYGPVTVDLAAPGKNIYSTIPGGYGYMGGTSMAAPHVAGVAGLTKAYHPGYTNLQIKDAILSGVDPKPGFSGMLLTGGRLNAYRSLLKEPRIGVFRNGEWYLDMNRNYAWDGTATDSYRIFGMTGDTPVMGDWNDDGLDEIGVFRNGEWYLDMNRNYAWDGTGTDRYRIFGMTGDTPVMGDWNNDGMDEIGVFRNGEWYLDMNRNFAWDGTATDYYRIFGMNGDIPVVGDWSDDSRDDIGVYRNGEWYLDMNRNYAWDGTGTDWYRIFGMTGDKPVAGDWNYDGLEDIGVYRNGEWYLDMNWNYAWDGTGTDYYRIFGITGDKPAAGFLVSR